MRVLVACEYSQAVASEFRKRGHDAWSCDLLPAELDPTYHILGDARFLLKDGWDLMIGHPPCTDLAVSGSRWFKEKKDSQQAALDFFARLWCAPIPRIALENPVSVISSWIAKPTQVIQPWQYGHGETKATCLWLKGLPKLIPTNIVSGREARIHKLPPTKKGDPTYSRWKERSRTYAGIAQAMAEQWGAVA